MLSTSMQTNYWFRVTNSLWMEAKFYNTLIFHGCAVLFFNRAFDKHKGLISNVKHICMQVYFSYIFLVWLTDPKGQLKSLNGMSQNLPMVRLRHVSILKALQLIPVFRSLAVEVRGVCGSWQVHSLSFFVFEWTLICKHAQ